MTLCSLQTGCCRDLHTASIPLSPISLFLRSTFLNCDWPERKATAKASMDVAVKSQFCRLLINKFRVVKKKTWNTMMQNKQMRYMVFLLYMKLYCSGTYSSSCSLQWGLSSAVHNFAKPSSPIGLNLSTSLRISEVSEVSTGSRSSQQALVSWHASRLKATFEGNNQLYSWLGEMF